MTPPLPAQPIGALAPAQERSLAGMWSWVLPALAVPVVLLELGYTFGNNLVPWILHRMDPGLLARDWFTMITPHHLNFIRFMAWAGRWMTLPLAFLVLHLAALFLLLRVMYQTAMLLFEDQRIFFVGLFLFLRWGTTAIGGNPLWADTLVPHNLTVPVCLLAFYFGLQERPMAAALAAAAATWIHVQLGAQTMLIIGLGLLWSWRRIGFRQIVTAGALYLAAVLPTVVPQWLMYVGSGSGAPLSAAEFTYLNAVLRQPHHLAPFSWAGADYYRLALVLAMAALARGWREKTHRTVLIWFGLIVVMCVIGTVFVEIYPVKLVVKMQLFRQTIFVKFFAVLYAARFLLTSIDEGEKPVKLGALVILVIRNYAVIGATLALVFAWKFKRGWMWAMGLWASGALTAVAVLASFVRNIPMFWHSFAVSGRGVSVGLVGLALLVAMRRWFPRLLPAVLLVLLLAELSLNPLPYFGYEHEPAGEWYQFCQQVKGATPRDAVLITPPFLEGFQLYSERAQVGDFKCFPFGEDEMREWKRRMNDLSGATDLRCGGFEECAGMLAWGYVRLREPDFLRLAQKYGAQYAVTSQPGHNLHFPVLLRRGDFVLYRIPESAHP